MSGQLTQRLVPLSDGSEWARALHGIPHSFWHTHGACAAFSPPAPHQTRLYVYEDGGNRLVCPIAEREQDEFVDVFTPFGFSGFVGARPTAEFAAAWNAFARQRGWVCGYVALHPILAAWDLPGAVSANSLYALDLRGDGQQLWSALSRSRQRQLREWDRIRPGLLIDRKEIRKYFVDNYQGFAQRVGAPRAQRFPRATLEALCDLDSVLMVGVGAPGAVEAAYLFGFTPHCGECLFNIFTTDRGRDHATAMLWWGVEELRKRAVPWLNMGGGLREDDPIARAKQQFGARRVPFRRLLQVYRPDAYARLCSVAGVSPDATQGYFPAYRGR